MLGSFFELAFFQGNRERLRKAFRGQAPIVLTANGLLQRSGDTTFPFRQDSNFWYLTGIDEPDVVLVMDKDKEYLIVPARDEVRITFDGQPDVLRLAERAGIELVYDDTAGWKYLGRRLSRVKHIATLPALAVYEERAGFYPNPARHRLIKKLQTYNNQAEIVDLRPYLADLRVIKQPEELRAIRRSIFLTSKALLRVHRKLPKFQSEHELEADISYYFQKNGAQSAYHPIIASAQHSTTLHYISNDAPLSRLVLLDVGAEVEHYAADISRTYAIGAPTKRLEDVHHAVQAVHQKALGLLKPGILPKEYEQTIQTYMGEKLRELGLIKSISTESVRKFYPHSTSHFLGLDVHDAGDYNKPLKAGMVLTVEPGIYIPKEGIGVRIEDDVLITKNGNRNLSAALPTSLS